MQRLPIAALLALAIGTSAVVGYAEKAGDPGKGGNAWAMSRGNAAHTGVSPYAGPTAGKIKWQALLGQKPVGSVVVAGDGTLYVAQNNGTQILAIAPGGKQKWAFKEFDELSLLLGAPSIGADGTVYAVCSDQNVYALTPDGKLKWKCELGEGFDVEQGHSVTPVVGPNGTIYLTAGRVFAVDATGKQTWAAANEGASFASDPAIGSDGTIYAETSQGREDGLAAVTPTGTVQWKLGVRDAGGHNSGMEAMLPGMAGTPSVAADGTVYAVLGGSLCAVSPAGTLKWQLAVQPNTGRLAMIGGEAAEGAAPADSNRRPDDAGSFVGSPAVAPDGTIYAGSNPGRLYAVGPDGKLKWKATPKFSSGGGMPGMPAGMAGMMGNLMANNPQMQAQMMKSTGVGSPTVGADGTIYAVGGSLMAVMGLGGPAATLCAFDPAGTVKWQWPSPANQANGGGGQEGGAGALDLTELAIGPEGAAYASVTKDKETTLLAIR